MKLHVIDRDFTVCKVKDTEGIRYSGFTFVGVTDEEVSLVCSTSDVPEDTLEREDGWRAFRIEGVLDFSLIGILSRISTILAEGGIGIFAVSTYNTDYILTKREDFDRALALLEERGYTVDRG